MDQLQHGAMGRLFDQVRAPSTLGTFRVFLRVFSFGHVRQLDAVAARPLVNLVTQTPLMRRAGVQPDTRRRALASVFHGKANTGTLRTHLITVPERPW
jgi:hypothetical protein